MAVEATCGPVLIVAGPGTGKTWTLTHRLAHLIADCGIAPEQCLALTFSRRAAAEMQQRLARLLPEQAQRVPVMTFHALGLSILREHGSRLGLSPSLRVATETERRDLLARTLLISPRAAEQLLERIARQKRRDQLCNPAQAAEVAAAMTWYEREMRARQWVDFEDLVALPVRLLESNCDLVEYYRDRYRWISVDEYQDIDAVQYRLLRLLVPPHGNLCAIGDPDQAIYGFRGADVRYFQQFGKDFPGARTVLLRRNYRSTQAIVEAALEVIAPRSLVPDRGMVACGLGPEQIEIHTCASEYAEAEFVVHSIERMLGGSSFFSLDSRRVTGHEAQAISFGEFAVLYRTESQADALVEALERSGIPFQRRSHRPLAEQPVVQAILRQVLQMHAQCPARPVLELVDQAAKHAGIPERTPDFNAIRFLAARHETDLGQFLSELALGMDADLWDPRADRVSLLTLHAAKGLEFPVVFIVGCEQGLLPLYWGTPDEQALAEERRLLFVGMTRAQRRLILTCALKRRGRTTVRGSTVSPFLEGVRRELLAFHQHPAAKRPARAHRQQSLFDR